MNANHFMLIWCISLSFVQAQTKVSGYLKDQDQLPIAYANIIFSGSSEGTVSDENGKFYLESESNWNELKVSFLGYKTYHLDLKQNINYNLTIYLEEDVDTLGEVVLVSGKQSKKNNPAVEILKKIWSNKRTNGLNHFDQYAYKSYEKVEFDLNTIDSVLMRKKIFKGMEFIFNQIDTSSVTGKNYLPIFITEKVSNHFGDNQLQKSKTEVLGTKNSGFSNNQMITDFVDDLYPQYSVYNNYIKIFDKSFTSPLSTTGIDTYNYVLTDSAYIDHKWCYNIVYYPRRKNELTFKGDFWVNDSTYAVKQIALQASKSANINWIKEIYIEQDFEVLNDSIFLLKRDYMMSDFSLKKKESSRGVYGKRTTVYDNYVFDRVKPPSFYKEDIYLYNEEVSQKDDLFWEINRLESLNKNEKGVYAMLDTLKTVNKFKRLYNIGTILASGYIEINSLPLDYGPIFSSFGSNEVEGNRFRAGLRTYYGPNDLWRIQAYVAYGARDKKFKYGFSAKGLLSQKNRLILSVGNRRDIEQLGASLTMSNDILGRSLASSSIVGTAVNDKLSSINLTALALEAEPLKNLVLRVGANYRILKSASPSFSLDYIDLESVSGISSELNQLETELSVSFFPNRKMTGFGVERQYVSSNFVTVFSKIRKGIKGPLDSDFDYTKIQFAFIKPWQIGGVGRLKTSVELGKTIGTVPLSLLSPVPGNQSYFSIYNTFSQLDFYEFVTDSYASAHVEHNFNGRIFSRIPLIRALNLREIISFRALWGSISPANVDLNNTSNPSTIILKAPSLDPYYEYGIGVGNIFKILRIDFNFRGNYFDYDKARKFGITGSLGFNF